MRITRISPKLFGRFMSESPLDVPSEPLVVVHGRNESGKSTVLDFVVTLLSSQYDRLLLERYGEVNQPLQGSMTVEGGEEVLTISLGKTAKVPTNRSNCPRSAKPDPSRLWGLIKGKDLETVRNLFRVTSVDVLDGKHTKEKFRQYLYGDKRGRSVTESIEKLRTEARNANREFNDLDKRSEDLDSEIAAQVTSTRYLQVERRRVEVDRELGDGQDRMDALSLELGQIAFAEGMRNNHVARCKAESALEESRTSGTLVPVEYGSKQVQLDVIAEEISRSPLRRLGEQLENLRDGLRTSEATIDQLSSELGLGRQVVLDNPDLMSESSRKRICGVIRTHFARIKVARGEYDKVDVEFPRGQWNEKSAEVKALAEAWEKVSPNVGMNEYLGNSDESGIRRAPSARGLIRNRWIYVGLLTAAAATSAVLGQFVGAVVLAVVAIVSASSGSRPGKTSTETTDGSFVTGPHDIHLELAKRYTDAVTAEGLARASFEAATSTRNDREGAVTQHLAELERSLSSLNLGGRVIESEEQFDAVIASIDHLVTALKVVAEANSDIQDVERLLRDAEEEFRDQKDSANALLASIGVETEGFSDTPEAFAGYIRSLSERFKDQRSWQMSLTDFDAAVRANGHSVDRIRELLGQPDGRLSDRKAELEKQQILERGKIIELVGEAEQLRGEAKTLSTREFLVRTRLEKQETRSKMLERTREHAQKEVLAAILQKRATDRAEESSRRLSRHVETMALSVMSDWSSVDFVEENDELRVRVGYASGTTVDDVSLASGARTILFMAMRIAIMQNEGRVQLDTDGEVFGAVDPGSLPLLCDDPLLHLDDGNTRKAFEMMSCQADGHQILYFTCKNDIVDMARSIGVPVVVIS